MFVRQTIAGWSVSRTVRVVFSVGVDFIFEGAFHSCYREFILNPCNVDLCLVEFVFDPLRRVLLWILLRRIHFLLPAHHDPFHANPPPPHTHTQDIQSLGGGGVFRGFQGGVGRMRLGIRMIWVVGIVDGSGVGRAWQHIADTDIGRRCD